MHLKVTLLKFIFSYLFFSIHSQLAFAYAPTNLDGYKSALTIDSATVDATGETHLLYFTSNTTAKTRSGDNGQWYPDIISWNRKNSREGQLIIGHPPGDYVEVDMTFKSSTSGSFNFTNYEDGEEGSGTGTFTFGTYQESEIPYNYYFTDDFSNLLKSEELWPVRTNEGITNSIKNQQFLVSGNILEGDDRWHDVNANSILSLSNDWTITGSSYTKIPNQNSLNYQAAVGLDSEVGEHEVEGFEFEISIGISPWGIMSEVYISDLGTYASQYQSASRDFSSEGTFRVFNSTENKIISSQYLHNGVWTTIYQLNWETGLLKEKNTNSGVEETHQFSNWQDSKDAMVAPMMDFTIPHTSNSNNEYENVSFEEGDLGFTSFSVTEGAPEPDPEYAPSSLVGKIYKGSMNDTYQFIDESNAIFYHKESNFQSSEVSNITYTWSPDGNSGTLTTSLNESTTLSFTSAVEGSFSWNEQESGETSNGTFTLEEATTGNAPSSLVGDSMIAGKKTYIFKENGVVTIRTTTGSQDTTYGFVKSGNNEIVFNIPAHADGVTSTIYKMTFSSTAEGTLSEGGSGSFQYFIDGSNQPPTKGWMWFNEYPWVYSNVEAGWLYFKPTGSKLMVYSIKDQAWREMTE